MPFIYDWWCLFLIGCYLQTGPGYLLKWTPWPACKQLLSCTLICPTYLRCFPVVVCMLPESSIFRSMRWGLRLTAQKLKKKKQKACSAEKKKNVLQNRKPRWINDWRCPEAKWNPSLSRKSMKARQKGRSLGSPQEFFPTWRSGRQIIPEGISRNTHSWVSLKDLLFPRGRVESNRDREKIC